MGGPEMAPHTPHALGAPRRSRGTPRYSDRLLSGAPKWPPIPPHARGAPAKPWHPSILRQAPREAAGYAAFFAAHRGDRPDLESLYPICIAAPPDDWHLARPSPATAHASRGRRRHQKRTSVRVVSPNSPATRKAQETPQCSEMEPIVKAPNGKTPP